MARHLARRVAKPRHVGRVPLSLVVSSGGRAAFGKADDQELGQGHSRGERVPAKSRSGFVGWFFGWFFGWLWGDL
jgi:hypothetical protein